MSKQDPADLVFSARTDLRSVRKKTSDPVRVMVYGFFAVALVVLFFMLREILARARASAEPVALTQPIPTPEPMVDRFPHEPIDRTPKVFRCVGTAGAVSFQSFPCAPGERTTAEFDATPDSASEVARARRRQHEATRAAASMARIAGTGAVVTHPGAGADDRDARRANCEAAKARRDAILRTVGLRRTYELLQELDAPVYEACKGL